MEINVILYYQILFPSQNPAWESAVSCSNVRSDIYF